MPERSAGNLPWGRTKRGMRPELERSPNAKELKYAISVGFMPLGITMYLYFLRKRKSNAAVLTIFLGFATSLTIEIVQAYIPQRFSGMTDIITNTSGTALGVLLLQPRAIRMMLETWGVVDAPPQTGAAQ